MFKIKLVLDSGNTIEQGNFKNIVDCIDFFRKMSEAYIIKRSEVLYEGI